MKIKLTCTILFLFLGMGSFSIKAQSLIIRQTNGSEISEPLNAVQKLSFASSDLLVSLNSGSTDAYALSGIQKLYFSGGTFVSALRDKEQESLFVYPNSANETLNIYRIPVDADILLIYGLDGRLMLEKSVTDEQMTLDISNLSGGLYFIKANGSTSKFIKQ